MFKRLIALTVLLSSYIGITHANETETSDGFNIQKAWIAEAPPVSRVMVAYMKFINNTSEEIEIIKAQSELYSSIEFHETKHEGGMARMIRHNSLILPANSHLELKRGAKHLMLFNPKRHLKAGDNVLITFTTKDNLKVITTVIVEKTKF